MNFFTFFGIVALIGAAIAFAISRSQKEKSTVIAVTETSTAHSLDEIHRRIVDSLGADALQERCEVSGTVECDTPLTAPLTETPCVAYRYALAREYEEQITETDPDGNETTETRTGSETQDSQDKRVQFWVRDTTGRLLVDPTDADLDMKETGERYDEDRDDVREGRYTVGYRHREQALAVGAQVYILGFAVDHQGQPMIARHPSEPDEKFLISWRGEQELVNMASRGSRNAQMAAVVLGVLGVVLLVVGMF